MPELRIPCPVAACRCRRAAGRLLRGGRLADAPPDLGIDCRGPASPVWRWLALTYRCMLPHMVRLGLTLTDKGDPDTLADRLVAAATAVRAQIASIPQACAWA